MKGRIVFHRILFVLYIAAVVWLCIHNFKSVHDFPRTIAGIPSDKIVHFCMFFPFPFLTYISYERQKKGIGTTLLFVGATLLLGIILAVGTEIAQSFLPYRTADYKDLLADSLGLLSCSLIVLVADIRFLKHKHSKRKH